MSSGCGRLALLFLFALLAFLFKARLALSFEFVLHGSVLQAFLFDLLQAQHLGFGSRLQVGEVFASSDRLGASIFEFVPGVIEFVDGGVEVVGSDELGARRSTQVDPRGRAIVAARYVTEQHEWRLACPDELTNCRVGQARPQHGHLALELTEPLLSSSEFNRQGVQARFRIEHRLGGGICSVASIEDLASGAFCLSSGVLGGGVFGRHRSDAGQHDRQRQRQRQHGRAVTRAYLRQHVVDITER